MSVNLTVSGSIVTLRAVRKGVVPEFCDNTAHADTTVHANALFEQGQAINIRGGCVSTSSFMVSAWHDYGY